MDKDTETREKLENTSSIPVKPLRDANGRLLPNQPSLNPAGKPKGARHLSTLLEEAIKKIADGSEESYDILLVKRVLKKAIGDGDMRAVEHIWDRIEGKPPQKIENTNVDIPFDSLSDEQKAELKALL